MVSMGIREKSVLTFFSDRDYLLVAERDFGVFLRECMK